MVRAGNNGTLLAAGLIAGEALIGLLFAALAVANIKYDDLAAGPVERVPGPVRGQPAGVRGHRLGADPHAAGERGAAGRAGAAERDGLGTGKRSRKRIRRETRGSAGEAPAPSRLRGLEKGAWLCRMRSQD